MAASVHLLHLLLYSTLLDLLLLVLVVVTTVHLLHLLHYTVLDLLFHLNIFCFTAGQLFLNFVQLLLSSWSEMLLSEVVICIGSLPLFIVLLISGILSTRRAAASSKESLMHA